VDGRGSRCAGYLGHCLWTLRRSSLLRWCHLSLRESYPALRALPRKLLPVVPVVPFKRAFEASRARRAPAANEKNCLKTPLAAYSHTAELKRQLLLNGVPFPDLAKQVGVSWTAHRWCARVRPEQSRLPSVNASPNKSSKSQMKKAATHFSYRFAECGASSPLTEPFLL